MATGAREVAHGAKAGVRFPSRSPPAVRQYVPGLIDRRVPRSAARCASTDDATMCSMRSPTLRRGAADRKDDGGDGAHRRIRTRPKGTGRCAATWWVGCGGCRRRGGSASCGRLVVHEKPRPQPAQSRNRPAHALEQYVAFAPDARRPMGGYPGDEDKARGCSPSSTEEAQRGLRRRGAGIQQRRECSGKVGVVGVRLRRRRSQTCSTTRVPDLAASVPFYGAQTAPEMWRRSRRSS